jgi:hypothetical protein
MPHAAVVGVAYDRGVLQVAYVQVTVDGVRLQDRPDRWTTLVTAR